MIIFYKIIDLRKYYLNIVINNKIIINYEYRSMEII